MGKKKKQTKRRSRRMRGREKRSLLVMALITGSVGIALAVQGNTLKQEIQENSIRQSALEQQLEEETKRKEDLKNLESYIQSDEYIEKAARDQIGMIKDNEILFREK